MKLTTDENEYLQELLANDEGIKALYKLIGFQVKAMEEDVLSTPLSSGNETELVYRKLRAEGAAKLHSEIKRLLKIK